MENKEKLEVLTSTTGWPLFLVKASPPNAKIARETPAANTLKLVDEPAYGSGEPEQSQSVIEKVGLFIKKSSFGVWPTPYQKHLK